MKHIIGKFDYTFVFDEFLFSTQVQSSEDEIKKNCKQTILENCLLMQTANYSNTFLKLTQDKTCVTRQENAGVKEKRVFSYSFIHCVN